MSWTCLQSFLFTESTILCTTLTTGEVLKRWSRLVFAFALPILRRPSSMNSVTVERLCWLLILSVASINGRDLFTIVWVCLRSQNVCDVIIIVSQYQCQPLFLLKSTHPVIFKSNTILWNGWEDRCNFKFYTLHVFVETDNDIKKINVQDFFKIMGSQIVLKLLWRIKIAS